MEAEVRMDAVYSPSDDVVAREIEGEIIIVPLVAGIGDMEDELFTLNETGKVIWYHLDGEKTLAALVDKLAGEFGAPAAEIAQDVVGFVKELLKRRMLVEVS
jgi:hypothetical protein